MTGRAPYDRVPALPQSLSAAARCLPTPAPSHLHGDAAARLRFTSAGSISPDPPPVPLLSRAPASPRYPPTTPPHAHACTPPGGPCPSHLLPPRHVSTPAPTLAHQHTPAHAPAPQRPLHTHCGTHLFDLLPAPTHLRTHLGAHVREHLGALIAQVAADEHALPVQLLELQEGERVAMRAHDVVSTKAGESTLCVLPRGWHALADSGCVGLCGEALLARGGRY